MVGLWQRLPRARLEHLEVLELNMCQFNPFQEGDLPSLKHYFEYMPESVLEPDLIVDPLRRLNGQIKRLKTVVILRLGVLQGPTREDGYLADQLDLMHQRHALKRAFVFSNRVGTACHIGGTTARPWGIIVHDYCLDLTTIRKHLLDTDRDRVFLQTRLCYGTDDDSMSWVPAEGIYFKTAQENEFLWERDTDYCLRLSFLNRPKLLG